MLRPTECQRPFISRWKSCRKVVSKLVGRAVNTRRKKEDPIRQQVIAKCGFSSSWKLLFHCPAWKSWKALSWKHVKLFCTFYANFSSCSCSLGCCWTVSSLEAEEEGNNKPTLHSFREINSSRKLNASCLQFNRCCGYKISKICIVDC